MNQLEPGARTLFAGATSSEQLFSTHASRITPTKRVIWVREVQQTLA